MPAAPPAHIIAPLPLAQALGRKQGSPPDSADARKRAQSIKPLGKAGQPHAGPERRPSTQRPQRTMESSTSRAKSGDSTSGAAAERAAAAISTRPLASMDRSWQATSAPRPYGLRAGRGGAGRPGQRRSTAQVYSWQATHVRAAAALAATATIGGARQTGQPGSALGQPASPHSPSTSPMPLLPLLLPHLYVRSRACPTAGTSREDASGEAKPSRAMACQPPGMVASTSGRPKRQVRSTMQARQYMRCSGGRAWGWAGPCGGWLCDCWPVAEERQTPAGGAAAPPRPVPPPRQARRARQPSCSWAATALLPPVAS